MVSPYLDFQIFNSIHYHLGNCYGLANLLFMFLPIDLILQRSSFTNFYVYFFFQGMCQDDVGALSLTQGKASFTQRPL